MRIIKSDKAVSFLRLPLTTEAIRFWRLRAVDLSTSKQLKAGAGTQQPTEPPNADRRVLWVDFSYFLFAKR